MPVHKRRTAAHGQAYRFPHLLLVTTGAVSAGRGVGRISNEIVAIFFNGNAERPDQRLAGKLAVIADRQGNRDQSAVADPPPLIHRRTVSRKDDVAIEHEPADANLVDFLRLTRREADNVAILLNHRAADTVAEREARMLGEVARLAMDGNHDFGPNPIVHLDQLGPSRMAGDMDMRLALGDDLRIEVGKLVHDPADRDLVARDDPR